MLTFAADYPFLDVFWTMLVFFAWVVWIWMMVIILTDLFARRDIGGWHKAAWCVFMIVLPFLGVLVYLIAQHDKMAERTAERLERSQQQFDDHVRSVARQQNGDGAVGEIEAAERLLARGTINADEFAALKSKALAAH